MKSRVLLIWAIISTSLLVAGGVFLVFVSPELLNIELTEERITGLIMTLSTSFVGIGALYKIATVQIRRLIATAVTQGKITNESATVMNDKLDAFEITINTVNESLAENGLTIEQLSSDVSILTDTIKTLLSHEKQRETLITELAQSELAEEGAINEI